MNKKSGLFLLELMVVVVVFAISAAICLQLFAYASRTSQRAEDLNQATLVAQSVAGCYQATGGDLESMAPLLSATVEGETLWGQESDGYGFSLTKEGTTAQIEITNASQETVFTLAVGVIGGEV